MNAVIRSMKTGAAYWSTMALAAVVSLFAMTKNIHEKESPMPAPTEYLQKLNGSLSHKHIKSEYSCCYETPASGDQKRAPGYQLDEYASKAPHDGAYCHHQHGSSAAGDICAVSGNAVFGNFVGH